MVQESKRNCMSAIKVLVLGYFKRNKQIAALLACGHVVVVPRTSPLDCSGGKRLCTKEHNSGENKTK